MRPDRLILQGFRSHRKSTEVVFTEDRLLAIVGDTGAGKSSLLSALTFALYARAPEASSKKGLINDECDQLMVQLDFTVEGETWTVMRVRRRVGAPIDHLKHLDTDTLVAEKAHEVNQRVTELLGLDFEQFCRAVVLPQGRFDQILLATASDRATQLRSLLGVAHIEGAGSALSDVTSDVVARLTAAETQRRALPDDPAAALTEAATALEDAEVRLAAVTNAAETVAGPAVAAEAATQLIKNLERLSVDTTAVTAAAAGLAGLIDPAADLARRHEAATAAKRDASQEEAQARAAVAELPSVTELTETAARLDDIAAALPGDLAAATHADQLLADLPAASDPIDPAVVAAADRTAGQAEEARRLVAAATKALAEARDVVAAAIEAADAASAAEAAATTAADAARTAAVDASDADAALAGVRLALDDVERQRRDHDIANAVSIACANHAPGDQCPVCGHTLDEGWAAPTVPEFDKAKVVAAKAAVATAEAACTAANRRHQDLATKADAAASAAASAAARASEASDNAVRLVGDDYNAGLAALAGAVDKATTEVEAAQGAAEAAAATLKAAEHLHAGAAAALAEQRRAATTEGQRCAKVLEAHRAAVEKVGGDPNTLTTDAVSELAAGLRSVVADSEAAKVRLDNALDAVAKASSTLADLAAEKDERISGPAGRHVATANAVLADARAVRRDLVDAGESAGPGPGRLANLEVPASVTVVASLANDAADRALAAGELDTARATAIAAARDRLTTASRAVTTALAAVGVESVEALNELRGSLRATTQQRRVERDQADAAVAKAAELSADIARLGPLAATLDLVRRSTTTAKFGAHLVATRQEELLTEASIRLLEISKGRFGFGADFEIVVPETGRTRQPTDLSGGERFQASLALALALVEIVTRGSGRLESVFIDEGFGSLDVASLDDALATLTKVATEGRLVALISHLHRVADYVDSVLHVREDDLRGSVVQRLAGDELEAFLADDGRSGLSR